MMRKTFLSIFMLLMPLYCPAQQSVALSASQSMQSPASQPVSPLASQPAAPPAAQPMPVVQSVQLLDPEQTPQSAAQPGSLTIAQSASPPPVPAPSQSAAQLAQGSAPPPRAGSDWQMVEALRAGTSLYLNAKGGHKGCALKSVTADALICKGTGKDAVYPRAEIWTIKIGRRGRSALIGAIPGGVMMAAGGIGLATEKCGDEAILCGLGPGILVAGGGAIAIVGATIGALTDFSKSTIYTAP